MSLFDRIGDHIIARAMKAPTFHIDDYMERYRLVPYGYGVAVRVHHILRSDSDRVYHDHPWPYLSLILRTGYTEKRPVFESGIYVGDSEQWHGPGSVVYRPARSWHRLFLPPGETAWTLVFTGPKVQRWGFLETPNYKVYHRDYMS